MGPGLLQEGIHKRGFSMIDMGDDGNVPNVFTSYLIGHSRKSPWCMRWRIGMHGNSSVRNLLSKLKGDASAKIPTGTAGSRRVPNERPAEYSNYSIELQIATESLSKEIVVVL